MVIALHKPYGVLCQFTPDQAGQRTLAELGLPAGVYPVGRLDMDSEGLLLLTDEPGFNHRLLDPKEAHQRTYWAQVEGLPSAQAMRRIQSGGLEIKGHRTLPCEVQLLEPQPSPAPRVPPIRVRRQIPTSWLELRLHEGKNRQVRRMTAAVGLPTLRLIRTAIGAFSGESLRAGDWRQLEAAEVRQIWFK